MIYIYIVIFFQTVMLWIKYLQHTGCGADRLKGKNLTGLLQYRREKNFHIKQYI